jgi:cysteinyl-tRNA synthetase
VVFILGLSACGSITKEVVEVPPEGEEAGDPTSERNYRQDMRDFVRAISDHAKGIKPNFVVIPQNGHELLTENGAETGAPALAYLKAIDGVGREDLFYGYDDDDVATPTSERDHVISFMDIAESDGVEVLATDYCSTESFMDDSYYQNTARGYISFAVGHRELDNITEYPSNPVNMNPVNVMSLAEAKNFLYLINPGSYSSITDFLNAVRNTNYDVVIIDAFYEGDILTAANIASLRTKINGGHRLVIAYMSIGEAEDYRYYSQNEWVV